MIDLRVRRHVDRVELRNVVGLVAAACSVGLAAFACGGASEDAAATPTAPGPSGVDDGGATGEGGGTRSDASAGLLTPAERCEAIKRSVEEAGFGSKVSVTCDGAYANVGSDTYPDHIKMNGITGTNDQVPVPAPGYVSPIALSPVKAAKPTSIDAALGVAVNGVPIYDYSSQGANDLATYDPKLDTKAAGELDVCNGHSGRGDDYHYHASPVCMIAAMKNKGAAAILGWGFDGYPIFGDTNPDGSAIATGELDVCNAKNDATYGARYHTSQAHPYITQCLVGEVDLAKAPRVPPLSKPGGGGGRPPGNKPPGGVTNLTLVEDAGGARKMTYDHAGKSYSITYAPSTTAGCWDFEDRSFTTGGNLVTGTYCRTAK